MHQELLQHTVCNKVAKGHFESDYSLREIKTIEEFRGFSSLWDELASRDKYSFPFLCFDWIDIWLEHFLKDDELLILLVFREDTLVGIAPFISKKEMFKGLRVRKIGLIGNFYSHVSNLILVDKDRDLKEQVLSSIFGHLSNSPDWDVIDLQSLPEEQFDFDLFYRVIDRLGNKRNPYTCFGNWYLNGIDCDGTQYLQSRTGNIKNNIKRYRRTLESLGKLEFTMVTEGDSDKIDYFMDHYYVVYSKSWKKKETDPTFHRDIVRRLCKQGWVRLGFLFLNDIPIAAQLWFVCGGVAHILKLIYDEEYKKFIPGIILSAEMVRYALDVDKVKEVDFGIGDDPYKKDWTPYRRERKGVLIFNRNIKAVSLYMIVDRILPAVNKYAFLKRFKEIIRNGLR